MINIKKSKLSKVIVILLSVFMLLSLAMPAGRSVRAADLNLMTEAELESYFSQAGGPNPPAESELFAIQEAESYGVSTFSRQTLSPQTAGVREAVASVQAVAASEETLQVPDNAYLVIDISEWQNPNSINYDLLCQQIDGVILRVGHTGSGHDKNKIADVHFERHYREFKNRGVPIGVYWFSRADTVAEAEVEANMTLSLLKGKELQLPIYWDTEDNYYQYKTKPELLTKVAISYIDTIRQAGREVGIYASVNWYLNRLVMSRLWEHHADNFFEVWVAHYNSWIPGQERDIYGLYSPQFYQDYWMWQFTSTGRLNGYNGSLDFNFRAKNGPDKIVRIDQTAPEIKGASSVTLLQGLEFDVYAGVRAWDDKDGSVGFTASPKTINTNKVGTYYIDYTAVDAAGNRGSHVRTVTVVPTTFSDVPASHWAYPYVENLYEQGIVRGYGETGEEYRPANKLTREHAATIISRAAGLSGSGKEADFSDLTPDNDYYPFIAALVDKGAITGFPDGTFRGRENIRRGHAAKIVALAFDLKMGSQTVSFSDMPSDPEICEYIMILASNGIISGYSDTGEFRPNNQITRAEFAKIISIAQEVAAKQNP